MQDQKTAGQAEDWELSEAYYKEDTGKKELRLEDFLEEETAEGQGGLADGSSLTEQLEAMAAQVKRSGSFPEPGIRQIRLPPCWGWTGSRCVTFWCVCSPSRRMTRWP